LFVGTKPVVIRLFSISKGIETKKRKKKTKRIDCNNSLKMRFKGKERIVFHDARMEYKKKE